MVRVWGHATAVSQLMNAVESGSLAKIFYFFSFSNSSLREYLLTVLEL